MNRINLSGSKISSHTTVVVIVVVSIVVPATVAGAGARGVSVHDIFPINR